MHDAAVLKEAIIFPRYHQRGAVSEKHSRGSDFNCLIQHSANFGKTFAGPRKAHRLSSLREADGKQVYGTFVVANGCKVVDSRL